MISADIAYSRQGAGDPLVLIHGIGHRRQAWTPVLERLARVFDVVALDLPGFGESAPLPPGTSYGLEATLGRLRGLFTELDLARPHVVGNSLGGALALELGARDLVRSVTAISPAGYWTPRQHRYAVSVLRIHRRLAGMPSATLQRVAHNPRLRAQAGRFISAHPERVPPDLFMADSVALHSCPGFEPTLASGDTYDCLARPSVPTTVAWGTLDRILRVSQSAVARQRLPDAVFRPLIGCGHVPMYDDPDAVVDAIISTTRR